MRVGRSLRGARAAVFAVACVGVSAAGHVWMSGAAIPAWTLLVALLATYAGAYGLAGRRRGPLPIAVLMLAGELGLHMLFDAGQRASGESMSAITSMPGMAGMAGMPPMPGMSMPDAARTCGWMCGGTSATGRAWLTSWMSAHGSLGMIAVHATAGLLCAGWLWRGEAACFRLLELLALLALPLLALVWPTARAVAPSSALAVGASEDCAPISTRVLGYAVVRRGPPACLSCM